MPLEPSHSSLVFSGQLPLAWRTVSSLPEAAELQHYEQTNLHILHNLFALDIHAGDHGEDPSAFTGASELKRLDFKVSLILEILGQLFAAQQAIPPECPLTLTVTDLTWRTTVSPPPDQPLRLELYCNLGYPRPLVLHAHVREIRLIEGAYQITALFHQPGEALQEALERYIFLRHRRFIANQRGNSLR